MRSAVTVTIFVLLFQIGRAEIIVPIFAETPQLSIRFSAVGVEFSGAVDSEETGQLLASSVKSVRPDLTIINNGLQISGEAVVPRLDDLRSLLEEIGLTTHEGLLVFWKDRVLLSGLTDSVITTAALTILIEPILDGRPLVNRICIVHTDDLPDLEVNLTTSEPQNSLLEFESYPTQLESFELPGLAPEKLYSTLVMLSDLSRINGIGGTSIAPIRALPLAVQEPDPTEANQSVETAPIFQAVPTDEVTEYISLPSVLFSRNTYTLQTHQPASIDELAQQLIDPPLAGHPLTLLPVRCKGGTAAFNDYLCENRGNKVKELLVARGVEASLISILTLQSSSDIDEGEVRLRVEVPVELEKPPPLESEASEAESPLPAASPREIMPQVQ